MSQGKLQRSGFHIHLMTGGNGLDVRHLLADRRRGFLVFEVFTAGENARAVRATDNDIDILFQRFRHQALQGAFVVQQRVAASQQERIRLRLVER